VKLITLLACCIVATNLVAQTSSVIATPVLGTSTTSSANNNAAAVLTQNFASSDPTTGRLFTNAVQPYQAPVLPYLGPWNTGSNIIDDLRLLPEVISLEQAKLMYNGGVSARINRMADGSIQFKECKLLTQLPLKKITGSDGKDTLVPDDSKFERRAFIFLQGNKKATTVDVIGKAVLEALDTGADSIFLMKKVTGQATSSTGFGLGLGYVAGGINGNQMNQSQASSGGTGFNHATAKPIYTEGMVVLALKEINQPKVIVPVATTFPVVVAPPVAPVVITEEPVSHNVKITLDEVVIHFDNGKAIISSEGQAVINHLVNDLKNRNDYLLNISGFTSVVGTPSFNERLSNQRAKVISDALINAGIPSKNIKSVGKTSKESAINRRVEIEVITSK
jgi:outer membrane protein OmpA-like peptidoglycan-associated protein